MKCLKRFSIVLFVTLFWISYCDADELPRPKVDYSADLIMNVEGEIEGERLTIEGKINYSKTKRGDKERRELIIMGRKNVVIIRRDKQLTWVLMPEQNMYIENILGVKSENDHDPMLYLESMDVKLTKIGKETINNIGTTKYKIVVLDPDGEKSEGFLWLSKDNISVAMEGTSQHDGKLTQYKHELKNLKVAKQNSELFEIPVGYNKFNMPSMGGMNPGGMIPDMSQPGGIPPGEMSEEQMKLIQENMKKQMEEMMKRFRK